MKLNRRACVLGLVTLPLSPLLAAPTAYELQKNRSKVGFVYTLLGTATQGTMPIQSADVIIDPEALERSSIDVSVDASKAKAGLIFATEALKSPTVLDVKRHPTIRFKSRRIRLSGQGFSAGAQIDGDLTVKGQTRPVTLAAQLFRQAGTQAGDLSQLSFRVSGRLSRNAFGASGYADLVADDVSLDITARVKRR